MTENRQTQITDYLGGFQYLAGKLDFLPHAEGYVKAVHTGSTTEYHYVFHYTDHLGNIRLSYGRDPGTGKVAILKESHYYPFGLTHKGYVGNHRVFEPIKLNGGTTVNLVPVRNYLDDSYRYTFGGKEEQPELGLNWIDHHARNYDATLGRWMNVDPLGEKMPSWSPYNYAFNNPVRYIDPTGMAPDDIIIRGKNNSSITIVTDLIDISVNAGSIVGDLEGNYTFQGEDILVAALDIVGIVDPTGVADVAAGSIEMKNGNFWSGLASYAGIVPLIGDAAKLGKIPKHLKTIEKAIDGAKNGRKGFGAGLDTQSKTSKQAFNQAKDQNGIPRSQQPDKQYTVPDKNTGKPLRQYEYTNSKGEKVNIRKDNPVKYPDGGKQGPHYNAGQTGKKLKQHHNYE